MEQDRDPRRIPHFWGVKSAFDKISAILPPTPLLPLVIGGRRYWCKCESRQPIGAFKLRGAWHRLTDLAESMKEAGVVAFSSGNHAQGVAWAARRLGMPALIVMPSDAPVLKVEGTRALGAEIVFYDRMSEDRAVIARRIAREREATLVPSFDDPWIIEGQGSAGLEIMAQRGRSPSAIVTPCGGGGLAAGLALACPQSRVVPVEPEGWDDMARSLESGSIVPVAPDPPHTSCDALQTLVVSPLTFGVLSARGVRGCAVSEAETAEAMRAARQELGLVLEPGGAVALAAVRAGRVEVPEDSVIILSGGNVDPAVFQAMTRSEQEKTR
jgi:threonine dehydratase